MAVTAKVILDSISPEGIRLTTLQLRYPRMVHADFMTHRVFSRNGRSSRAVPFKTLVSETPYVPDFHYNQSGMVAGEKLTPDDDLLAQTIWNAAANYCQSAAKQLSEIGGKGVHKQWVNRMLEWFGYIDVLVTSTDWENFRVLRMDSGAQPEIIELATKIDIAMSESDPLPLTPGQWHLPYVDQDKDGEAAEEFLISSWEKGTGEHRDSYPTDIISDVERVLRKLSVARCARLTIKPFDGNSTIEAELKRYGLLMESRPVHASPAEHIATPDRVVGEKHAWNGGALTVADNWEHEKEWGNLYGWRQFRKMIPHNTIYDR